MLKSSLKVHFNQMQIPAAKVNPPTIILKVVEVEVAVVEVEMTVVQVEMTVVEVEVEVMTTIRVPIMLKMSATIVARIIILRMSVGTKTNHNVTIARSLAILQRIVGRKAISRHIFQKVKKEGTYFMLVTWQPTAKKMCGFLIVVAVIT